MHHSALLPFSCTRTACVRAPFALEVHPPPPRILDILSHHSSCSDSPIRHTNQMKGGGRPRNSHISLFSQYQNPHICDFTARAYLVAPRPGRLKIRVLCTKCHTGRANTSVHPRRRRWLSRRRDRRDRGWRCLPRRSADRWCGDREITQSVAPHFHGMASGVAAGQWGVFQPMN